MTSEYLMTRENAHEMTVHEKRLKILSTALSQTEGNKSKCLTMAISVLRLQVIIFLYTLRIFQFCRVSMYTFHNGQMGEGGRKEGGEEGEIERETCLFFFFQI